MVTYDYWTSPPRGRLLRAAPKLFQENSLQKLTHAHLLPRHFHAKIQSIIPYKNLFPPPTPAERDVSKLYITQKFWTTFGNEPITAESLLEWATVFINKEYNRIVRLLSYQRWAVRE